MSEIKAFSSASVEAELKYRESLSVLNSSYRYREQNLPRTIELIDRAKGTKSIRRYADELGMNPSSVSRILNGQVNAISNEVLARVACVAIPESGVTLEDIMDAQGLKREVTSQMSFVQRNEELSSIVIDDIVKHGYCVTLTPRDEVSNKLRYIDFTSFYYLRIINTNALSSNNSQWFFSVAFRSPSAGSHNRSSLSILQSFMAQYYINATDIGRSSIIFDLESDYQYFKTLCSNLIITDEISLILVSREERRVLEEYIIPLRDGSTPKSVFNKINKGETK